MHAGTARGVVVATGRATEFGKITVGFGTHQLDTEFQVGLRKVPDGAGLRRGGR